MRNVRANIIFLLFLVVMFLLLAVRCFYLQYFKSEYYKTVSIKQHRQLVFQKAQRGVILDCRGRVLAASNRFQTIFADPQMIKDVERTSVELAPVVGIEAIEIRKLIIANKDSRYLKIKPSADANQCRAAKKISGIGVETDWRRYYPMGRLAGHVVGFTSTDNRGLGGIELQYNKELSGSGGRDIFVADISRRPIRYKQQESVLSDGSGLILTLDASIQQFAREELLKQYEKYEAESAVAIVASVKTGAILAVVSLPDFEPGHIRTADVNNLRNKAISDQFEPGSILKPIATAIAIDCGVVKPDEKIFCEDGNYRGKGFGRIKEYRNRRYGKLSVREILVYSSNIGMAKLGQRLGKERLYKGLKLFGFGKETGVDLPGETEGLLRTTNKWTGYSVTRVPFGQEISVTAIELVRAFCILANGGRLVKPFIVKAIVDSDGDIVELKGSGTQVGFVVKPETANWIVRDALVGVINEGTGRKAKLEKWQLFGKTGTAQLAKSDGRGYSDTDYVASFIAGAPAEEPEVVVLVSIRKPNIKLGKGYTGGTVAAPVVGRILEKTLNYSN